MNIFNIAFLILLYTKSSVECGTTYHHHNHRIPRHSAHNSQKKLSAKVTLSEESNKSSQETNKQQINNQQDFPCNTFICLLEKFEVMKTPNGVLLKRIQSQPVNDRCSNLSCWLNRFKIKQTSYGYELTDKAVIMQESTFSTIDRPRSTTPIILSTETTIAPTTTDESLQDFDQWFDDYLY
jgi:hypothetical protein